MKSKKVIKLFHHSIDCQLVDDFEFLLLKAMWIIRIPSSNRSLIIFIAVLPLEGFLNIFKNVTQPLICSSSKQQTNKNIIRFLQVACIHNIPLTETIQMVTNV
uniref:Uncharacterized protein n=1 Tax=Paramoeba aestuarina TaxID=180227 RepID=A0A7S4KKM7_9EUKA